MTKKRLGVLGGMGPKATSIFYDKLISRTKVSKDQDHIDTMILSHASLPDRTQIIREGDHGLILEMIEEDFKIFEAYHIQNIAIPCNTLHFFYDKLKSMTSIHIIHMPAISLEKIAAMYGTSVRVGILATDGTVDAGVYDVISKKLNLTIVYPDQGNQSAIMEAIYTLKATGSLKFPSVDKIIHKMLKESCDIILLACTELSVMELDADSQEKCLDAMDFLVDESIRLSQ